MLLDFEILVSVDGGHMPLAFDKLILWKDFSQVKDLNGFL